MLRYMEQRLAAPVSLHDLAAAAGVSTRTLDSLCHRHFGDTPMNLNRRSGCALTAAAINPPSSPRA